MVVGAVVLDIIVPVVIVFLIMMNDSCSGDCLGTNKSSNPAEATPSLVSHAIGSFVE